MKNKYPVWIAFCFASALFSGACSKKQTLDIDNETQSVVDNAVAGQEFMVIPSAMLQCALNTRIISGNQGSGCDTLHQVSGDTLFGSAGHVDPVFTMPLSGCSSILPDGKARSGSLSVTFKGRLREAGTKTLIKLQDYKADGIFYSCESLELTTVNFSSTSVQLEAKLLNGICQSATFSIGYNFDNFITTTPGAGTLLSSVYGTANGTTRTGKTFMVSMPQSSPLERKLNCEFVNKGVLELTPEGYKTRTVDFGDGTCDADATFSVNGNTLAFKLK